VTLLAFGRRTIRINLLASSDRYRTGTLLMSMSCTPSDGSLPKEFWKDHQN
jgi:hypothetical protein